MHLLLPNLVIELQVRPCSCHATRDKHTFHLYSRTCKLQSAKATSAAKSNNRTPGETLQRNMSSASMVEVASSGVLEHLPLPNLIMEHRVNPRPNCAGADKYTSCLYSRSCKLQTAKAPSIAKSSSRIPG